MNIIFFQWRLISLIDESIVPLHEGRCFVKLVVAFYFKYV